MDKKMLRLTHEITVNRDFVSSVFWRNGYHRNHLIVRMADGFEHEIEHQTGPYATVDCYKIEKELANA